MHRAHPSQLHYYLVGPILFSSSLLALKLIFSSPTFMFLLTSSVRAVKTRAGAHFKRFQSRFVVLGRFFYCLAVSNPMGSGGFQFRQNPSRTASLRRYGGETCEKADFYSIIQGKGAVFPFFWGEGAGPRGGREVPRYCLFGPGIGASLRPTHDNRAFRFVATVERDRYEEVRTRAIRPPLLSLRRPLFAFTAARKPLPHVQK